MEVVLEPEVPKTGKLESEKPADVKTGDKEKTEVTADLTAAADATTDTDTAPGLRPVKAEIAIGKEPAGAANPSAKDEKPRTALGKKIDEILKDTRVKTEDGKKGLPKAPETTPPAPEKKPVQVTIVPGDASTRKKKPWWLFWMFWR
jgi:hypothetical protein